MQEQSPSINHMRDPNAATKPTTSVLIPFPNEKFSKSACGVMGARQGNNTTTRRRHTGTLHIPIEDWMRGRRGRRHGRSYALFAPAMQTHRLRDREVHSLAVVADETSRYH